MRQTRRHRGFVLIMAVAMIPLFGLAVLLTTDRTAQLSRSLRMAERRAEQKTLLLSAEAWLRVNGGAVDAIEPGQLIAVPIGDAATPPATCSATVIARENGTTVLTLTATGEQVKGTVTKQLTVSSAEKSKIKEQK